MPSQCETLAAILAMEARVRTAPLEGVVPRYANPYGRVASPTLVESLRRRMLPTIGDGGGVWSWLHVEDAAAATLAALEHGAPGSRCSRPTWSSAATAAGRRRRGRTPSSAWTEWHGSSPASVARCASSTCTSSCVR